MSSTCGVYRFLRVPLRQTRVVRNRAKEKRQRNQPETTEFTRSCCSDIKREIRLRKSCIRGAMPPEVVKTRGVKSACSTWLILAWYSRSFCCSASWKRVLWGLLRLLRANGETTLISKYTCRNLLQNPTHFTSLRASSSLFADLSRNDSPLSGWSCGSVSTAGNLVSLRHGLSPHCVERSGNRRGCNQASVEC